MQWICSCWLVNIAMVMWDARMVKGWLLKFRGQTLLWNRCGSLDVYYAQYIAQYVLNWLPVYTFTFSSIGWILRKLLTAKRADKCLAMSRLSDLDKQSLYGSGMHKHVHAHYECCYGDIPPHVCIESKSQNPARWLNVILIPRPKTIATIQVAQCQ